MKLFVLGTFKVNKTGAVFSPLRNLSPKITLFYERARLASKNERNIIETKTTTLKCYENFIQL